jgi:hypothetical protein
MPTRPSIWIAFCRASALEYLPWARSPSASCQPTVNTGFSAVDGSWKIMAAFVPRIERRPFLSSPTTSVPSRTTVPSVRADSGSSPRMVRAVTVFPLPDSPTIASTSARRTSRVTPRTACTSPPSVANETLRSSISTAS